MTDVCTVSFIPNLTKNMSNNENDLKKITILTFNMSHYLLKTFVFFLNISLFFLFNVFVVYICINDTDKKHAKCENDFKLFERIGILILICRHLIKDNFVYIFLVGI